MLEKRRDWDFQQAYWTTFYMTVGSDQNLQISIPEKGSFYYI